MHEIAGSDKIFLNSKGKAPSDMALSQLMCSMRGRGELNVDAVLHGFRSSFRDWAAEQTNYPDEIRKAVSMPTVGDSVKAAYQRTDLLEKRKQLVDEWADLLDQDSTPRTARVTSIRSSR